MHRLIGLVLLFAAGAWAQPTATIVGRVTDPSGAVISGAKVTARNADTGLERSTLTGVTGDYELPLLPITGSYSLSIEMQGFQAQEMTGIVLQVDQHARFDIAMKVGSVSEKVVVAETSPVVNTETGTIGQVIGNKNIVDLPLNGRNYTQLAALLPNAVVQTSGTAGSTMVSVSGGRLSKTEYLLDGISINEQLFDGVAIRPSVDAIQEFKMVANSFSAEYGRGNAVMTATIKGGTNEFHGVGWEFLRNDKLDARNTFLPSKAPYRQNQFGGALGGPIIKDKTFFFLNYEGTRIRQGQAFNPVVPSDAFRNGDFSSLSTVLRDPTTQLPLAGNKLPPSLIDPSTKFFLQFIPAATTANSTAPYAAPFSSGPNQSNVRIDQKLSEKNSLFVRHTYTRREDFNPGAYPTNGGFTQDNRTHNAVITDTHIFSPALINELRLGYTRFYNANINQGLGTNYTEMAGIHGFELTSLNFPGFPQLSISGFQGIAGNSFQPLINPSNMYEIVNNLNWVKGAHTLKFGVDLRDYRFTSTNSANSRGSFSFTNAFTGNAFADFLTGYPFSGARDFPRNQFGEYDRRYHFYVQDDWKISSRLTLNLGLRYELNRPPFFVGYQAARFDFNSNLIQVERQPDGNINLVTQQVAQFAYPRYQDVLQKPGDAGLPNNLIFPDDRDWAPRIGLAWRPFADNKTVVRAGAGLFYMLTSGNNTVSVPIINTPFIVDESLVQSATGGIPQRRVEQFFPPFSANANFTPPLAFGFDPHMVTPRMTQYNLAVQREVMRDFALEVAYVGNQSHHLEREVQPMNYPPINPSDTRSVQDRRPNPRFSGGSYFDTSGNANYNGLEVKFEKRYSRGYQFLVGYSWSKTIDMDTGDQGSGGSDNPYNYRTMRGPSNINFGQRLVSSFVVDLPFGKGRLIGSGMSGAADAILGGWQFAGILTFQGGFPFTPTLGSADPTNSGRSYGLRPNVAGTGSVSGQNRNQWFNINDFPVPAKFTIGNAGRNILRGPGLVGQDLSLHKDFHYSERIYLQFRLEYFNVFNVTNLSNPNTSVDLPAVGGKIFSTSTAARIGQVALKVYF
ncbi:MAG TPA: carboxypeptidase regulatory-like domain-containing protein [Bryobacterales bacterium]|nr:carboxypeptidase regulatory-like domain-containing protein [Bryobacterales bacterium]